MWKFTELTFVYIFVSTGNFPVSTGNFPVSTLVGVFVGTLWCALHRRSLNHRRHFRGHLRVHSRGHFREHFRESVRGSNFAVRVLCALLIRDGFFDKLRQFMTLVAWGSDLLGGDGKGEDEEEPNEDKYSAASCSPISLNRLDRCCAMSPAPRLTAPGNPALQIQIPAHHFIFSQFWAYWGHCKDKWIYKGRL